jgi:nucleoredoxin
MSEFKNILGSEILGKSGNISTDIPLNGKVLGFYFSAHWCPPCRNFTPMLKEFYNKLKTMGVEFEIIFVSSDKTEQEFNGYYSEMPWLALPFGDSRIQTLKSMYEIQGIPTLIFVNPTTGEILSLEGTEIVYEGNENQILDWCFA